MSADPVTDSGLSTGHIRPLPAGNVEADISTAHQNVPLFDFGTSGLEVEVPEPDSDFVLPTVDAAPAYMSIQPLMSNSTFVAEPGPSSVSPPPFPISWSTASGLTNFPSTSYGKKRTRSELSDPCDDLSLPKNNPWKKRKL